MDTTYQVTIIPAGNADPIFRRLMHGEVWGMSENSSVLIDTHNRVALVCDALQPQLRFAPLPRCDEAKFDRVATWGR